jgi:hypothetical protein
VLLAFGRIEAVDHGLEHGATSLSAQRCSVG